jgi:cation transport ATPase
LGKASEAIALSRKTVSIIKQSLFISIAINSVALVLASTGEIGPIIGAVIHNIGSIVVVGNSSRLIGYKFKKE